jgi:hypothetical protein
MAGSDAARSPSVKVLLDQGSHPLGRYCDYLIHFILFVSTLRPRSEWRSLGYSFACNTRILVRLQRGRAWLPLSRARSYSTAHQLRHVRGHAWLLLSSTRSRETARTVAFIHSAPHGLRYNGAGR